MHASLTLIAGLGPGLCFNAQIERMPVQFARMGTRKFNFKARATRRYTRAARPAVFSSGNLWGGGEG